MWTLWNKIYFIKNNFQNNFEVRLLILGLLGMYSNDSINRTDRLRNIAIPKTTRSYNRVIRVVDQLVGTMFLER